MFVFLKTYSCLTYLCLTKVSKIMFVFCFVLFCLFACFLDCTRKNHTFLKAKFLPAFHINSISINLFCDLQRQVSKLQNNFYFIEIDGLPEKFYAHFKCYADSRYQ